MIWLGSAPHPITVANKGLSGFPTKNVIILVVTVAGWGEDPRYGQVTHRGYALSTPWLDLTKSGASGETTRHRSFWRT